MASPGFRRWRAADPIQKGESGRGWVTAFHVLPLYRHTIEVLSVDETTHSIRTHEHGGVIRRWDHILHVEPVDDTHCRYSDNVEIDAGGLTALVAHLATGIHRHRQRRWHKLVDKHLRPEGPAYRLTSTTDGPA